jgi:hypothetical protein
MQVLKYVPELGDLKYLKLIYPTDTAFTYTIMGTVVLQIVYICEGIQVLKQAF